MSDDPVQLSLKLCAVLERIGVSASMKTMYRDVSISSEIMQTVTNRMTDHDGSAYRFGSSCEGTTTPDMGSDIDMLLCYDGVIVVEEIRDACPDVALLTVSSRQTRPGYVKLQFVEDGTPLTIHNCDIADSQAQYDCEGRVCLKHIHLHGGHPLINERNGPAHSTTNNPNIVPLDHVVAFRLTSFPFIATESLNKCNACSWMSENDVERMKRFGILLVGVGHQASEERDAEWRISFSLQERELMLALNPTQHKCYVLLKIIKNIITAHPDMGKALTSYHCKTCLFAVITDNSPSLWTDKNLIKCTFICLTKLMKWIVCGHCPNFFIKENNMFERREFVDVRERLIHYMRDIIYEGPMMFYHIESDHIGEALQGRAGRLIDDKRTAQMYGVLLRICQYTSWCQQRVLRYCHELPSDKHITRHLFKQLCYLTSINTITEHTREQIQMAVRRLEPVIHKLYAQHLASVSYSTDNIASRHRLLASSDRHLSQCRNCDSMSGSLLVATIMYRAGFLEPCEHLLEQIQRSIMHGAVVSVCNCYSQARIVNDYLERKVSSGYINLENIMEVAAAPCMMFLPSHIEILPKALKYEMYRSVCADPKSRDKCLPEWYDLIIVDSKIYLHFLQYLVYSGLNRPGARLHAMLHILEVLIQDPNLKHRETAYNLLGWIYTREGRIQNAFECFCYSWSIRPDHNAARWHMPGLFMRLREHL